MVYTTPFLVDTFEFVRCVAMVRPEGITQNMGISEHFIGVVRGRKGTKGDERKGTKGDSGRAAMPGGRFLAKESMVIYGDLMGFNGDLWWFYADCTVI